MTRAVALGKSFIDARSLVFWSMVGLTVYGAFKIVPRLTNALTTAAGAGIFALVTWLAYGLVVAVILYKLELFERRSKATMLGAFVWGAVVVAGIAITASPAASGIVAAIVGRDAADTWAATFAAPMVEEPLKMLGVVALALIPGSRINSALDGMFYGLIVGLGFLVTESFLLTTNEIVVQDGSYTVIIVMLFLRGIIGGLWSHPTYTAITGAGVGYFFGSSRSLVRRSFAMVGALITAIVLHGYFDSPFLQGDVFGAAVKGSPALILMLVLLYFARTTDRTAFERAGRALKDPDLMTEAELASLLTVSGRRKVRTLVRKQSGFAAGDAMGRLQRSQMDLIEAVRTDGPGSRATADAAQRVREERRDMTALLT